mgnify:FL=1
MPLRIRVNFARVAARGGVGSAFCLLSFIAGLSVPVPAHAGVQLQSFGVTPSGPGTHTSTTTAVAGTPAPVPTTWSEPLPSADVYSDSVGATPATYRTDESGAATYSVSLYTGTAGLVPALSLVYNSRGANGPMGPGWSLGGLSAISRCKKATEYGDGAGPFPSVNFDGVAADQAYCIDGARLLDLNTGVGNCPAGQSGDTAHEFGLELDPATRVCGYAKTGITGYAYWLVQPKDGSYRVYGTGGNSALVHNDGQGNPDTTQYFSWALNRIADTTGNTVEFTYTQNAATGEMDIAEVDYTGKIAVSSVLAANPTFSRTPYAKVVFSYATLPAASQRIDYVSGMKLALTQQLTTITASGPSNINGDTTTSQVARTYHLRYGTPTGSGLSALTSLQECVPNGSGEVCYPSTQFTWDNASVHAPGFPGTPSTQSYSGLQYAIDYKVGDVDGDGRQDLVWVKDQSCDSTGSGATRFQIFVSRATGTGFATAVATGVYLSGPSAPTCGTDMRALHFDSLWYLYDFSGDGRDDLLVANGTAWNGTSWTDMTWKIYPAILSGTDYTFDHANPVATGMPSWPSDDGLFLDENGDGLPDLMDSTTQNIITSHLLQKQSSGASLTFNFSATATPVRFTTPFFGGSTSTQELGFSTGAGRDVLNADLNGDGAADMVLKVTQDTCGTGAAPSAMTVQPTFSPSSIPASPTCHTRWYTFRNDGIQADGLHMTYETFIGDTLTVPDDGSFINLVDLNGDGQTDLVYTKLVSGNYTYYYRLNAGKSGDAAATERFLPEQSTGLTLSTNYAERVQFLDVNGDHKIDLLYWDGVSDPSGTYPLKAMLWGTTGFGSAVDVGNFTLNAMNSLSTQSFLMDVNGDGGPDLVTFAGGNLSVFGYGPAFGGNDFITSVLNGLGASTGITYYPLAYASGYARAYDGPGKTWGRGSPVFDVFSAIWVVHKAASSAPLAGESILTHSSSSVVYRYSGAKIQAGGRGFLGFATVQAENQQPAQNPQSAQGLPVYLVTTTEYRQDFPYIGRPDHTVVELESALQPDPCVGSPGDTCFVHNPPPCGSHGVICNIAQSASIGVNGQVLSDSQDDYTSTPAFAPGTVQPLMPYLSSSVEQKFDVATPGASSHEITSSFGEDIYGNVTSSSVISSESGVTDESKTTTNIYGCTVSPPTKNCSTLSTEWQRLGRLSVSTVTSSRPGQTNNVRRASFEYDPTTLLRIADIQGPYDATDEPIVNVLKTMGLRTDLIRDADGNVTEQVQCSTYHFANRAACTNLSGFQQRQWQTDPTKIQRYAKWNYESLGRFELDKLVPFYSATGTSNTDENIAEYVGIALSGSSPMRAFTPQAILPVVVNRDVFGNPANKVSAAGDQWSMVYGTLGRAYFAEDVTTGGFSRTTYTWCKDANSVDIPAAAPRANCPVGGVYRVTTDSTASGTYAGQSVAPTTWAYFDVLGRELLRTKRIYQQSATSKLHWSSVATTYDSTGRTATVSTPYFSIDPATAQTGVASSRAGTLQTGAIAPGTATASYDAVDRASDQSHPEEAANTPSDSKWNYATLTTTATNPRGYKTQQVKNARDEVMQIAAPFGQSNALTVTYGRDAVGNLTSISRTPADGSSAGVLIQTTMQYDRLGRKTGMTDPDKGGWTYSYNALGEPVSQIDAKGQTQNQYRDALGRLYLRTENRSNGSGGFTAEPSGAWEFDTALRSDGSTILGVIHSESNGIGGFTRTTEYNDYGRVDHSVTQMDGYSYTERQTYDQFGRPFQHFDPSTNATSPNGELTLYSTDGYPIATQEAADSVNGVYYDTVIALSERGQVTDEIFHNNAALESTRTFDHTTGRALTIDAGSGALQNWSYDYDKHSNVLYRVNHATGYNLREDFTYDNLDRLQSVKLTVNGAVQGTMTSAYDQLGNPTSRGSQSWTYATQESGCTQYAGPHAASKFGSFTYCYDANGNQTTANYGGGQTRTITYTGYDLPAQITTNGYPSNATESFAYAPDRSMFKRVEGITGGTNDNIFCNGFDTTTNTCPNTQSSAATTYYAGNVETRINGTSTTTKRYIGGYLVITTTNTNSTPVYAYLFRDALGSIDVIANELAQVQQRQSFDVWGNRRDATASGGWGLLPTATAASFDTSRTFQGYTGHQQLDPVGLIHMKGRLYDPQLGRFIQADPMTEADATQGLNRYSYVLNNPMSLTDPSGYLSFRQILGIAIGVVAACFGQWEISIHAWGWAFATAVAGGFLSAYVATGSLKAGLWGAFAGAAFFGIGAEFSQFQGAAGTGFAGSGFSGGAFAANVAAHAAAGGVLQDLEGGNFGSGFLAAGVTAALSPAIGRMDNAPERIMVASVVGGTVSKITGDKFANGAVTGFFQEAFGEIGAKAMAAQAQRAQIARIDAAADAYMAANPANMDYEVAFEPPALNQNFVDFMAGAGDALVSMASFGYGDLAATRDILGIDGASYGAAYAGGEAAGYAWGASTMLVSGLNGGSSSVFWSGSGNMERAAALGRSLESTPIGSLMNAVGDDVPYWGWKAASCIYACNASGTAIKVGLQEGTIWQSVEQPILQWRGIPYNTVP